MNINNFDIKSEMSLTLMLTLTILGSSTFQFRANLEVLTSTKFPVVCVSFFPYLGQLTKVRSSCTQRFYLSCFRSSENTVVSTSEHEPFQKSGVLMQDE